MNDFWGAFTAIILGIIGLATLAVVLGQRSQTTGVIQATSSGLSSLLSAALQPVNNTAGSTN